MKLIILGKTKDDKGTQLEKLTNQILEFQGYSKIVNNVQVSGASELDVTASKVEKIGINDIVTPVICECKAHEKPISMTDWLKFIGKLYIARKTKPRTIGLMLALSGANGAVVGSASSDFKDDPSVQLIANDDIILLLSQIYNLPPTTSVKEQLSSLPIPTIVEVNLVYYNSHVWWLVGCEDGHFILCHESSKPATSEEVKDVLPLLPAATVYQTTDFVDILNSLEVGEQLRQIEKLIVVELLKNGPQEIVKVQQIYNGIDKQLFCDSIRNSLFLTTDEENQSIQICDFSTISKVELYRFLLDGGCPVDVFSTEFYQSNINEDLLEQIWTIQGGFKLPEQYTEKCLQLLRLSPSAMVYVLQQDRLLHAAPAMVANPDMMNLYYDHFMGKLQESFINDFKRPELSDFYFHTYNINKVKITTSSSIAFDGKDSLVINVEQNYALAKIEGSDQAVLIETKKDL